MKNYENASLDELLKADICFITEDDEFYYVKDNTEEFYDNCIWKVDKKTRKASYMMFTEYVIKVADHAREVNPDDLRRAS